MTRFHSILTVSQKKCDHPLKEANSIVILQRLKHPAEDFRQKTFSTGGVVQEKFFQSVPDPIPTLEKAENFVTSKIFGALYVEFNATSHGQLRPTAKGCLNLS